MGRLGAQSSGGHGARVRSVGVQPAPGLKVFELSEYRRRQQKKMFFDGNISRALRVLPCGVSSYWLKPMGGATFIKPQGY